MRCAQCVVRFRFTHIARRTKHFLGRGVVKENGPAFLEESKKGFKIDIEDVVDVVQGRIAVLGNLDAIGVLQGGSEQDLEAEIARQVRVGRRNKGRFIMSIGSPVTPATPVERVRHYCDLVHRMGSA